MTSETQASLTPAQRGPDKPRGCADPLDTAYDVALLDLDGVVYLGGTAIPGAAQALRKAHAAGMRLAYVTNNAFRTPAAIAALLTGFGVEATAQDVVTSAQAAARLLAERLPAGAPVLVIGGSGLRMAVRERGLRPVSTAMDRPQAVVQGYWPDLSYSLLAEGGLAVAAGVGGAGEHSIFGGDPAQSGVAEEGGDAGLDGGGAQDLSAAHADEAGTLGVVGEASGEGDFS